MTGLKLKFSQSGIRGRTPETNVYNRHTAFSKKHVLIMQKSCYIIGKKA